MYTKLNITENHLIILSLFTNGFPQLHIRDIARKCDIAPRTAQLILSDLSKKGVLTYESKGRTILYSIQINSISEYYLCLAESYKKTVFLKKYPEISHLKIDSKIAIIFGSYAKGIEKKDSDIDLLIIGEYDKNSVKSFEKTYRKTIDVKQYPENAFKNPDILIKEVLQNHVILVGQEFFVNQVLSLKSQTDLS